MSFMVRAVVVAAAVTAAACSSAGGGGSGGTCRFGDARCEPDGRVAYCGLDGKFGAPVSCPLNQSCTAGACINAPCTDGETKCALDNRSVQRCAQGSFSTIDTCDPDELCVSAQCRTRICSPGAVDCDPARPAVRTCDGTGTAYISTVDCPSGELCISGTCQSQTACTGDQTRCLGDQLQRCTGDRWAEPENCPTGRVCENGACTTCREGARRCLELRRYQVCTGGDYSAPTDCPAGTICRGATGTCESLACDPGVTKKCGQDGTSIITCADSGLDYGAPVPCPTAAPACVEPRDGRAECTSRVCTPQSKRCTPDKRIQTCKSDGSGYTPAVGCPNGFCDAARNECVQFKCTPNEKACFDAASVRQCNADGTGWLPESTFLEECDFLGSGETCVNAQCVTPCELAVATNSYQGCEYWAVDLPNGSDDGGPLGSSNPQFSVVVANTSGRFPAKITITQGINDAPVNGGVCPGDTPTACANRALTDVQVPAGKLVIFNLPSIQWTGDTSIRDNEAFHVRADRPVAAYQFNPLDNSGGSFSNDASLLLPVHTLQTDYIAAAWQHAGQAASTLTLVGAADGDVSVTITLAAAVDGRAGAGVRAGTGIGRQTPGASFPVTLKKGRIVSFVTNAAGQDFTGTKVRCTNPGGADCKPFGVFGGHVCANIPTGQSYCDHVEEMLFPTVTWGTDYLIGRFGPRGDENFAKNADVVRIIALNDNTNLTWSPGPPAGAPTALGAGRWAEFDVRVPVFVSATGPISVISYMKGATNQSAVCDSCNNGNPGCNATVYRSTCWGDPGMALGVPVQQFRRDYVFLTPGTYRENFVNILAPTGARIRLNGNIVLPGEFRAVTPEWSVARVALGTNFRQHALLVDDADKSAGIIVYGWDQDVSYAYPGGLDLRIIQSR